MWYFFYVRTDERDTHERYHHGNLRNDLIEEGIRTLCRDGLGSFSVRDLSRKLGVSHAAAYRHFPSREDLLRAILVEVSNRFRTALFNAIPPGIEGEDALMRLGVGYVKFFVSQPELLSLFAMIPTEGGIFADILASPKIDGETSIECSPHENCDRIDDMPETSGFGIFRKCALAMRANPQFANLTEREILLGYWAKVHGIASILVTQKNFIPEDELDAAIERVVRTAF
jgi:AcrR family transcriptional regulator